MIIINVGNTPWQLHCSLDRTTTVILYLCISMSPYLAEIVAEVRFYERLNASIKWPIRRVTYIRYNWWYTVHRYRIYCCSLYYPFTLLAALGTLTPCNSVLTAGAFALQYAATCRSEHR